jgi:hypothetical protein
MILDINLYYAKIIDLSDDKVTAMCLVDIETKTIEMRKFNALSLNSVVTLVVDNYFLVCVTTYQGSRLFEYENMSSQLIAIYSKYFEPVNYFDCLHDTSFFQKNNN